MGGPSLTKLVQEREVQIITDYLETKTPDYKPKILYCLIDRNTNHRLFSK